MIAPGGEAQAIDGGRQELASVGAGIGDLLRRNTNGLFGGTDMRVFVNQPFQIVG